MKFKDVNLNEILIEAVDYRNINFFDKTFWKWTDKSIEKFKKLVKSTDARLTVEKNNVIEYRDKCPHKIRVKLLNDIDPMEPPTDEFTADYKIIEKAIKSVNKTNKII